MPDEVDMDKEDAVKAMEEVEAAVLEGADIKVNTCHGGQNCQEKTSQRRKC